MSHLAKILTVVSPRNVAGTVNSELFTIHLGRSGAMPNEEHVAIARKGAEAIQKWRKKNPDTRLDLQRADLCDSDMSFAKLIDADLHDASLRGANFTGADLDYANLVAADLEHASLAGATLYGAHLRDAHLSNVTLTESKLRRANLSGANLANANFEQAEIAHANLSGAKVHGANFAGARTARTLFTDLDLSEANGLDLVHHLGPSSVGIDTVIKSGGRIPWRFLRDCGIPPWMVEVATLCAPNLSASEVTEIQYRVFDKRAHGPLLVNGVFVSYSHADSKFVDKIRSRLHDEGAAVWLDRHDLLAGDLQKQIDRAIRLNDVVLLVLSKSSVESDWVVNELDMARRKEKSEQRDVLCPIALDDSWKAKVFGNVPDRALWRTLGTKNILDFSKWKTKAFDEPLQKLVRGLKVNYATADGH